MKASFVCLLLFGFPNCILVCVYGHFYNDPHNAHAVNNVKHLSTVEQYIFTLVSHKLKWPNSAFSVLAVCSIMYNPSLPCLQFSANDNCAALRQVSNTPSMHQLLLERDRLSVSWLNRLPILIMFNLRAACDRWRSPARAYNSDI